MEDRISLNLIYMGLLSAAFAMVLTCLSFSSSLEKQAEQQLLQTAQVLAGALDEEDAAASLEALDSEYISLTLFSSEGQVLYASDPQSVDTGLEQKEVAAALTQGSGTGSRTNGAGEKQTRCALLLDSGDILCLAIRAPRFSSALSNSYGYLILIFLILIPTSLVLSVVIARSITKPIKALPQLMERQDFDPEKGTVYQELIPLMQELTERRNERETLRQEFTANVSHELKTPLTTISGYSEMIASGLARQEDVPRFAEKIHAEAERMQTLVGDIIELNALDCETVHQHDEAVDMLPLVQDCVEQLSPNFAARHLSVYITGEGFTVQGNRRQLWELAYNLLDNARRYNVDGGMIRISVQDRALSVQDTGIGIPKEHQGRIFERFYRVDKSHSRATGGTGLGLSIVKHVAELHGAEISLTSQEHIGTEITVTFPEQAV